MKIVCPACQKAYRVADESAGKKVKCSCGHRFVAQRNPAADSAGADGPPALPPSPSLDQAQDPPKTKGTNTSAVLNQTNEPPKVKEESSLQKTQAPKTTVEQPTQTASASKPPGRKKSPEKTDSIDAMQVSAKTDPSPPDLSPASSQASLPPALKSDSAGDSDSPNTPAPQVSIQVDSRDSGTASRVYSRPSGKKNHTALWIGGSAVLLFVITGSVIYFNRPNSKDGETVAQNSSSKDDPQETKKEQGKSEVKQKTKQPSMKQAGVPAEKKKKLPGTAEVKSKIVNMVDKNDLDNQQSATPTVLYVPDMNVEVELEDREIPNWDPEKALAEYLNSSGVERERAETALVLGGDRALKLILETIRASESKRANQFATTALCRMLWKFGPRSVPQLLDAANDESLQTETRAKIVRAIGDIGPSAKEALPELVKLYHSAGPPKHRSPKLTVVNSFRLIGAYSPDVEKILLEILEDDTNQFPPQYLTVAVQAALEIGPKAKNLVPALRKLLLQNKVISSDAAEALGAIGPAAGSSSAEFVQLISEDNRVVSYRSFRALRDIGSTAKDAIPTLIQVLKESKYDFDRVNAANALGRMGPSASAALPTLQQYFDEADREKKDQPPRVAYRLAIARIKGNQLEAVPYIRKALYDNKHNARTGAAEYAGTLGKDGVELVPDLANMIVRLDTKNGVVRLAIHSLGHLGEHGKDGLGALIQFINKEHIDPKGQKTYRMHAITAMAQINSDDRVRRGLERIARNDPKLSIREHAQRLLFNLDAD